MISIKNDKLSYHQRWQLAFSLLVLYYPVLLYLDFPVYSVDLAFTLPIFYYQVITGIVILIILFGWINVSEWCLDRLAHYFGNDFMLEFRLPVQLMTFVLAILLSFAFIVVTGGVMSGLNNLALHFFHTPLIIPFPGDRTTPFWDLYKRANSGFFVLLMLSAFYLIANRKATLRMKDIFTRTETLEKENVKAQLAALKSQVNPHFLFNSLSILSSLVQEDPVLAEKFIQELAKTYRYILEQKAVDTVLLKEELVFLESYIFLLTIRFQRKIQITLAITNEEARKYRIVPMTLQLLIENAVKHNQMSDKAPLQIHVDIDHDQLRVSNTLHTRLRRSEAGGTGLQNIIARYHLLTEQFVYIEDSDTIFRVNVPLLTE